MAPEYAKAAAILKEQKIILGKVDATVEEALAKKFEVNGFPTIKFFIKKNPIEYNGGRTGDEIVSWINKRSGDTT